MSIVTGGSADEIITPGFISPTVATAGGGIPLSGPDVIDAGAGNDTIDGGAGADLVFAGKGDDLVEWLPGGGNDTVDGGAGFDTLQFVTSNASEQLSLAAGANGHLAVTRDVGAITMDVDNVEHVVFNGAGGGTDVFTIGDLSTTDVRAVDIDLGQADLLSDRVIVAGKASADQIVLTSAGGVTSVSGLGVALSVSNAEAIDRLVVNAGAGDDTLDASALNGPGVNFNGGEGHDVFALNGAAPRPTPSSSPASIRRPPPMATRWTSRSTAWAPRPTCSTWRRWR